MDARRTDFSSNFKHVWKRSHLVRLFLCALVRAFAVAIAFSFLSQEHARSKLAEELRRVELEVRSEKGKNRKYKIQQSNPDMPQVMDYVTQKSICYELEAAKRNWQRKVEIVEMAAKRARRVMAKQGAQAAAHAQQQVPPTFQAYSSSVGDTTHLPRIY